jgi:hypothetical protein
MSEAYVRVKDEVEQLEGQIRRVKNIRSHHLSTDMRCDVVHLYLARHLEAARDHLKHPDRKRPRVDGQVSSSDIVLSLQYMISDALLVESCAKVARIRLTYSLQRHQGLEAWFRRAQRAWVWQLATKEDPHQMR